MVSMPNLIGLSESAAIAQLEGNRLSYGGSEYARSDLAAGTVIGQSVEAFTEIEEHSKIILRVSTGPEGLMSRRDHGQGPERLLLCDRRGPGSTARQAGASAWTGPRLWWATGCSAAWTPGQGPDRTVEERRNFFVRPAVANLDALVFVAANVNPVTDPFLIDRVSVIAEEAGCELILCVNKTDLDPGEALFETFPQGGFPVLGPAPRPARA